MPRDARLILTIFAIAASMAGLTFLTRERPLSTFDAQQHYFRAAQIATGTIRAEELVPGFLGGHLRRRIVDFGTQQPTSRPGDERVATEFTGAAVYSPVNYLPQTLGIAAGNALGLSPLESYRLSATCNLAAFVALIAWAMRLAPEFAGPIAALALTPQLVREAGSQHPGAINFAVMAVFAAFVIGRAARAEKLTRQDLMVIASLVVAVCLLKPTAIVLLLLLAALPARCFPRRRDQLIFIGAAACVAAVLWIAWNGPYVGLNIARTHGMRGYPEAQQQVFFSNPWIFLEALARQAAPGSLLDYWAQYFGFIVWPLDRPYFDSTYLANTPATLCLVLVIALALVAPARPAWWTRSLLVAAAVCSFAATTFIMWRATSPVGSTEVVRNQGRYFGPAFLMMALAVPVGATTSPKWTRVRVGLVVVLLAGIVGLLFWVLASVIRHTV